MQDTRCVSLEVVNPRLVVRNGGFERPELGRLTPERTIRSIVEPEPAAPIADFSGHNRKTAVGILPEMLQCLRFRSIAER